MTICNENNKSIQRPCTLHKNKLKWIINLNVKCKNVKFLKDNVRKNLCHFGIDDEVLDTTPEAWSMKTINMLNLTKIKCLCSVKDIVKGIIRKWEKIFANVFDKGLVSKIYK